MIFCMDGEHAWDPESNGEDTGSTGDGSHGRFRYAVALVFASAVVFGGGVALAETAPEIGVDIDLKPFFIPYLLIGAVSFGIPTVSIALGSALGEGFLDIFEGYELDDPFGFLGYVFGFYAFGWYLNNVAADPTNRRTLLVAALIGAFVQAVFEGIAFVIFDPSVGLGGAILSMLGNTLTHGLLLGAIPLLLCYPVLHDRLNALLYRPT